VDKGIRQISNRVLLYDWMLSMRHRLEIVRPLLVLRRGWISRHNISHPSILLVVLLVLLHLVMTVNVLSPLIYLSYLHASFLSRESLLRIEVSLMLDIVLRREMRSWLKWWLLLT
jgi:hypothetical protein